MKRESEKAEQKSADKKDNFLIGIFSFGFLTFAF